jgi:hypothetical protein
MLAGAWAGFLKPPSDEAMASGGAGKKRAQTPATTAPLSKCARMALADEKRKAKEAAAKAKNVEEAAAEAAAAEAEKPKPAARPISKAERLMLAEQRKQEKVEKMEKAAADKIEKAEKKAAKDAHPKKPQTGYMIFCAEARVRLVEADPSLKSKVTEVAKLTAAEWKEVSEEAKKEFEDVLQQEV